MFASSFSAPISNSTAPDATNTEVVVMMTGSTGSLEGHHAYIWKKTGLINTIGEDKKTIETEEVAL